MKLVTLSWNHNDDNSQFECLLHARYNTLNTPMIRNSINILEGRNCVTEERSNFIDLIYRVNNRTVI